MKICQVVVLIIKFTIKKKIKNANFFTLYILYVSLKDFTKQVSVNEH